MSPRSGQSTTPGTKEEKNNVRTSAIADRKTLVFHGNARFTILADRFIRMEWAADGRFEDRPTLSVANRLLRVPEFSKKTSGDLLTITTDAVALTYRENGKGFSATNLLCRFNTGGVRGSWRFGQKDKLNLGGTFRTLDGFNGDRKDVWKQDKKGKRYNAGSPRVPMTPGLISRSGWSVFDDSDHVVMDSAAGNGTPWVVRRPDGKRQDLYLMAYGHDYRRWVCDASRVFGFQPLPPRFAFGYWYSRYWAYTDREIEELVREFDRMGVPLDVLVIDMDWHKAGWTGYTWDRGYFPDPGEFLRQLKKQRLKITMNLHPADGVGDHEEQFKKFFKELGNDRKRLITEPLHMNNVLIAKKRVQMDMTDPAYVRAYFKHLHHPLEREGVDFWWMDWQQGLKTKLEGLDPLPWINHLHWTDMATNAERGNKRPLCFSRYGGVGAGRYPVGFSGDTHSTWESLAFQPRFTAMAANVLYGYWSHDIGGHMGGNLTPELHARWVQYGSYSPILRSHSTKSIQHDRRFWNFPEPYRSVMVDAVRQRYALLPYIYTESRRCSDTGLSLCRPLYYHHPETPEAYGHPDQYYFGESILAAPVIKAADPKTDMVTIDVWLPEGRWFDIATGKTLSGGKTLRRSYTIHEVPRFVRPGSLVPGQIPCHRTEPGSYPKLVAVCYPGADGSYDLYEDDGVSQDYTKGKFATIPMKQQTAGRKRIVTVGPAKGSFKGFLAKRPLEIHLAGSVPPSTVKVNGRPVPWRYRAAATCWSYDGDTATTVVRIASADVRRKIVVEVTEDARIATAAIDGFAGLMRRLRIVSDFAKLVSPCWPLHKDERLAVWAAQTGNRIGRNPGSAPHELAELRKTLKRLPQALKEFEVIYRKRNKMAEAGHLAKARAILSLALAK